MLLSVENLHVYYGAIHAVKDVSLHVQEGEIVTLIGANGAGKSTVLNTISGILKPRSGKIQFMDHSLAGVAPNKIVQTGLVQCPEGRRVFARMTVEENLEMGAYPPPNAKFDDNLAHVYELFPRLKERRTQVGGTLSGGEQQMLAIGRGMMARPKLMMFDEPSLGLAPVIVQQVFEVIKELNKEGLSIMLIEQNAQKALSISDHAYIMQTGRVVMHGTGKELLADENMVSAYLGE